MNQSSVAAFILGFLTSVMFALAFFAGQQHATLETVTLQNQQVFLDSKLHLIEMKVDVITDQKDTKELQSDYNLIMDVLEQSHQYTGEGIIAHDKAMREAAQMVNEAIVTGGQDLVSAIEVLLEAIERHLHLRSEKEQETEQAD